MSRKNDLYRDAVRLNQHGSGFLGDVAALIELYGCDVKALDGGSRCANYMLRQRMARAMTVASEMLKDQARFTDERDAG